MATSTDSQAPDSASDANFRLWGKSISDALTAMGLPKTADAGQIDWTTVTRPLAGNTSQGFEIRTFNDSLQASAPVYFRIDYGSGGAAARPAIWHQFGDGSDGIGGLTGATSTQVQCACAGNNLTLRPMKYSGDTNRFHMLLFYDSASSNYAIVLSFERTKDSAGADTSDGILILSSYTNGGSTWRQQYFQLGVGPTTIETRWGVLAPSVGTGSAGANVATYPVMLTKGVFCNPPLGMQCAFGADVPMGTAISLTIYDASHTFFCGHSNHTYNMQAGSVANRLVPLMRFE